MTPSGLPLPGSGPGTSGAAEPAPVRHPPAWVRRIYRVPGQTYAIRIGTYALVFVIVAGSMGVRVPLLTWVLDEVGRGWAGLGVLLLHLLRAVLIALAGTAVSVVAGNLVRLAPRGAGPSPPGAARRWTPTGAWTARRVWPWLTGLALTLGCAAQARLANDAGSPTIAATTALTGLILIGPLAFLLLSRIGHVPGRTMWIGIFIGVAALGLRLVVPVVLGGNVNSGAVHGVALGEITRAMAAISAAVALTGARLRTQQATVGGLPVLSLMAGLLGRLLPALLMIALLIAVEDLGPAVILLLTMAAMALLAYSWAYWWPAAGVTTGLGLVFAAAGWALNAATRGSVAFLEHAGSIVEERLTDGGCDSGQRTQACKSLRVLHETGLLPQFREIGSGQPSGSTLVRHLEVADSDYAITLLASWVGMALVVALLAAVLATGLRMFLGSVELPEPTEAGNLRTRIGAAAGLQLMLPTALLGLAILLPKFPGTQSKWPLTGLDVPFVAANGVSTMVYCALLALGALMIWRRMPDAAVVEQTRNRLVAARVAGTGVPVVLFVLATGAVWIHAGWDSAGSVRLAGESLLRDNYALLLTRDGTVFSEPNNAGGNPAISLGSRLYPNPDLAVDLGFFLAGRSSNQAVGLERLAAPVLTCGEHHGRPLVPIVAPCSGADTITTVDARIQREAAGQAEVFDTERARAEIVLVERATGAITALASSDADNLAMQQVITQDPTTSGWLPPTLLLDRDSERGLYRDVEPADLDLGDLSRDRAVFASNHLLESAARCVTPKSATDSDGQPKAPTQANPRRPGEPWTAEWPEDLGPSRAQCEKDKRDLAIMRAWYETSQPGSTFKVVTALAALDTGSPMPPATLTPPLTEVEGLRIQGKINERSSLARCGKQNLDFMLLQSCNTTAAWLGIKAGWDALAESANQLGFEAPEPADPQAAGDTDADASGRGASGSQRSEAVPDEGGAILGPSDPSDPQGQPGRIYYGTSEVGTDPETRLAKQADGEVRPLSRGAVAFATGSTAIGQDQVRASILDMAAMTHAIVGAGPLTADDGTPSTDAQVTTEYAAPRALNMVAGSCTAGGEFTASTYPTRTIGADEGSLALIRRGMWWAVNHPDSATAADLRPATANGAARPIEDLDVIWAKTGSADLGPVDGQDGPVMWARWAVGATDRYVFAARVKGYPQGGGKNPAVRMVKNLLDGLRDIPDPPSLDDVCTEAIG